MQFGILFTSQPNPDEEPYPHRATHARVTEQDDPFAGFTWNEAEHEAPLPLDSEDMKPEIAAD